jgi:hypothetical protein
MSEESKGWGGSRYSILIVVLMLHAALIAALLVLLQARKPLRPAADSLELVFLAPVSPPKVRISQMALPGPRADIPLEFVPRVIDTSPIPMSAAGSSSLNGPSGVDWTAEARRALQAFEIRSHQLSGNKSVSARPEEDNWIPSGHHHAGEQLRIANGDWIVWIDANCYKVASAGPGTRGTDYKIPEVICAPKTRATAQ